ncbi:hypothetical protein EAH88_11915 [Rhodanobacter glycinis]|uniref:Uncharacterized protein n=1 Tax=Rhodanobacter glycinis TaxID=582702 RepID=A0A502C6J8_9GAMM|nr:hypothetical protein [Rhodanobacter glycinis]TPG08330.1 hypothetical protein EAH88_11915 [Rhodanobacter glycinis]
MTDYERHLPPLHSDHDKDRGVHVRTVLQGLILAGVLWVGTSLSSQNTAITKLQVQIEQLQMSIAGMPDLSSRVTKLETNQAELIRRQGGDDARWDQLSNTKMKGWTR